jgi:hypothetical protein
MALRALLPLLFLTWATVAFADHVGQVSSSRLSFIINGNVLKIPYYRNLSLTGSYPQVDRAVVDVHGDARNASQSLDNMVAAATVAGVADSTALLIAPQFLIEEDISYHGLGSDMLFWSEPGWKEGDRSLSTPAHPRPDSISTYALMDSILYRIASHNPNLHKIIVAGHSAGGQFVNRYAAGNTIEQVLQSAFGVAVYYVAANPSSYLYFTPERLKPGTTSIFEIPSPAVAQACPEYNWYKYGLEHPNSYMANVAPAQLKAQYSSRRVTCLLGELDANPTDPSMDMTCAAKLQGEHRLARGQIYRNHLNKVFGSSVLPTHLAVVIAGVGHNSTDMFTSVCGAGLLFGATTCPSLVGAEPAVREPRDLGLSFPDPLPASAPIRFWVPREGPSVTLRVYDVRGCPVRTLVDGALPAGVNTVLWDGRTDRGTRIAPGIYFCRLQQGSAAVATKLAIVQ